MRKKKVMTKKQWLRTRWIIFAVACAWQIGFAVGFFALMASSADGLFWKLLLVYLAWVIPGGLMTAPVFHADFAVALDESDEQYNSEGHLRYETQTKSNSYVDLNGDIVITEEHTGQWVHDTQNSLGYFMLFYVLLFPVVFLVDGIIIFIRLIWQTCRLNKH